MFRHGYDLRDLTVAACRAAGFEPVFTVEGGEMDAVLGFVRAGLGIAVVPAMVVEHGGPGLRATPLMRLPAAPHDRPGPPHGRGSPARGTRTQADAALLTPARTGHGPASRRGAGQDRRGGRARSRPSASIAKACPASATAVG